MRHLSCLLAALVLAGCASPATSVSAARLRLVKVPVTDVAKSAAFYRDALGLTEDFTAPEYGWAQYATGAVPLCLYVPGKGGGNGVPGHCDSVNLAVRNPAKLHEEIAGRWKGPLGALMKDGDGELTFEIKDPDGNTIRFVQEER